MFRLGIPKGVVALTTTKITIRKISGEVVGQAILGNGEHIIGREPVNGLYIDEPQISRAHAKLLIDEQHLAVEDMASTSGTYLDGVRVQGRVPIRPGQKVHIGDLYLDIEREGFQSLVEGARLGAGRFTLVKKLGQGGMGEVWLGLDEQTNAYVAMKLLPADMADNELGLRDMEREVAKTKSFNHPNIVQTGGLWHTDNEPAFLSLEYVNGIDLEKISRQAPNCVLQWEEINDYMLQLAHALEFAHSKQIAHRDIKPANLLVDQQGNLKLADFGIAASINTTMGTMTKEVISAGTPSYMSPQQVEGAAPQAADDIYSMGATIYDLLTGTPPFHSGEIIYQVINSPAVPMSDRLKELGVNNIIPDHVSSMVMACLQKDPAQRPPSAASVHQWIQTAGRSGNIMAGERKIWNRGGVSSSPHSDIRNEGEGIVKSTGKKKWMVAALVSGLVLGVVFTAWRWSTKGKESGIENQQGSLPVATVNSPFFGEAIWTKEMSDMDAASIGVEGVLLSAVNREEEADLLVISSLESSAQDREIEIDKLLTATALHPKGKLAAVATEDGEVLLVSLVDGRILRQLQDFQGPVQSVCFSSNGLLVAAGQDDEENARVSVWRVADGGRVAALNHHDGVLFHMEFNPAGTHIAVGYESDNLILWNIASGKEQWRQGHDHSITAVTFNLNGTRIATGSDDGIIRINQSSNGKEVAAYGKEDFDAHINDISWSPDGRYLLTGHDNNLVLLRDAATGVLALTLKGHTESVGNVGFNRDGSRIYTGGADDTIRVWK